jgi:lysozyme family protein
VLVHEGGYSNHPSDPGGPTNWGITIHDARAYWKTEATAADVRSMPVEVAKDIYRSKYWDAMRCDDLPAGVDYAVFDYGVNSGIGRAVRVLQRLAGTNVDGEVGPDTIAATARTAAVKLINQICDERLAFLQGLETWGVFGKGWGRRVREVRVAALAMVDEISRDIGACPPWLVTMRGDQRHPGIFRRRRQPHHSGVGAVHRREISGDAQLLRPVQSRCHRVVWAHRRLLHGQERHTPGIR